MERDIARAQHATAMTAASRSRSGPMESITRSLSMHLGHRELRVRAVTGFATLAQGTGVDERV